jgi:signal transduction histidine kinase
MQSGQHGVTVNRMQRLRAVLALPRSHPSASDAALAGLLVAVGVGEALTSPGYLTGSKWIYVPAAIAVGGPLAWRRRYPFTAACVTLAAFAVQSAVLDPTPTPDIELAPALIAVYSASLHAAGRAAVAAGVLAVAAGLVWLGLDDFLLPVLLFGGAWLAGRLVSRQQRFAARVAAAEERVRLARELHDAVGHSVSVMVVHAGAERLALGDDRPSTREALLAIERTGREVLAEMSRLLGILRSDGEGLALAPRPTLAHVDSLVQTVRDAGVPVELRIEGSRPELRAEVDVSAYRVLQEALTNVVKHAGPAHVHAAIRYLARSIELEVVDDGRGPTGQRRSGYGLTGMRERVELHGGTLEAGGGPRGGFVVRATLPLEASMP